MNTEQESDYKSLYMDFCKRQKIAYAVHELSELLSRRIDTDMYTIIGYVDRAEKYLQSYRNTLLPKHEFTSEQADISKMVHTWFRKNDDSYIGSVIYNFVCQDKGMIAWSIFIKMIDRDIKDKKISTVYTFKDFQDVLDDDSNILWLLLAEWMNIDKNYTYLVQHISELLTTDN